MPYRSGSAPPMSPARNSALKISMTFATFSDISAGRSFGSSSWIRKSVWSMSLAMPLVLFPESIAPIRNSPPGAARATARSIARRIISRRPSARSIASSIPTAFAFATASITLKS
ncbi:MAG: hypothetical protein HMLKMBBP_00522 [Planctomycetes bacterium]|nr:hypothetical protein [Planctomycetota bacterium]